MIVATYACTLWRSHEACIARVVNQTTNLVVEVCRYINTVEVERCGETTINICNCITAEVTSCIVIVGSLLTNDVTLSILLVNPPLRLTGLLIHACVRTHIECIERKTLSIEVRAAQVTIVTVEGQWFVLISQVGDLSAGVSHIEVERPVEVLATDDICAQLQLDTGVSHITDISVVTAITE